MQIKIDMKILIFLLIFYLTNQIKVYILLMIFACLHELGHLGLGLILGFKPISFEIKPIGFSASFYNLVKDYNKKILNGNILELKKIFVYLIGPITNIVLALIIYYIKMDALVKQELIYINLIILSSTLAISFNPGISYGQKANPLHLAQVSLTLATSSKLDV